LLPSPTFKKDIAFHVGEDTDTNTRRTVAAKQRNNPGTAADAAILWWMGWLTDV